MGNRKTPPAPPGTPAAAARRGRAPWLLAGLAAAVLAAPHLAHPLWHDELYTIHEFTESPRAALTNYHVPNNHILFSLQWGLIQRVFPNPAFWRLFPYACLVAAAAAVVRAGRRWTGSARGGMFAGLVFATAHPALAFGVELRGYSPSMLYAALALYALGRRRGDPRRRWLALYAAAAFCAVGTVPVNLAAFAPMAAWMLLLAWRRRGTAGAGWGAAAWCAASPFAGLAFLWPVRAQLAESVAAGSAMAKATFLWHFPYATVFDFLWLPLLMAGAWAWGGRRRGAEGPGAAPAGPDGSGVRSESRDGARPATAEAAAFLALAVLVPMACALVLPRTPNDYTMAAVMPGVALGVGWLADAWARRAGERLSPAAANVVGAVAAAGLLAAGAAREAWPAAPRPSPWLVDADGRDIAAYNLYRQHYQDDWTPITMTDALARWLDENPGPPTLALFDGVDAYTVRIYWLLRHGNRPRAALALPARTTVEKETEFVGLLDEFPRVLAVTPAGAPPPAWLAERMEREMDGRFERRAPHIHEWRTP